MAFTSNQEAIAELYIAAFGRAPEQEGLNYWVDELEAGNRDLANIRDFFMNSTEATNTYSGSENEDIVDAVYNNVLGRAPDSGGRDYWTEKLDTGEDTTSSLIQEVIKAANNNAGTDAQTLTNKLDVADHFLNTVDLDQQAGKQPDLRDVTDDATTVDSAITDVNTQADELAEASLSIAAASTSVTEGDALTFTVSTEQAPASDLTLEYRIAGVDKLDGAADPVTDLGARYGTVTIAAGEKSATFDLTPASDSENEGKEGFEVSLLDSNNDVTSTTQEIVISDPANAGQTFTLTTGVDEETGGAGNDIFRADYDAQATDPAHTLSGLDSLDGGAGNDTLNITSDDDDAEFTLAGATISNIEEMTIRGADDVEADVSGSKITGLNTLSVNEAVAADLLAGATTDVNVSGATGTIDVAGGKDVVVNDTESGNAITIGETANALTETATNAAGTITVTDTDNSGANAITIDGGTDVTVTTTVTEEEGTDADPTDNIIIGDSDDTGEATPTGDVSVTQNLINDGESALDASAAEIEVTGGTTVDVAINATSTAKDEESDSDTTLNEVDINGTTDTTEVTVTQNATVNTFTKDATDMVPATQEVTFKDLAKDESVTVNGLTFTATKTGGLKAAEVAEAFSNLTEDDTQDAGGNTANGYYTGSFNVAGGGVDDWTSGAANGAKVTFTAPAHNSAPINVASSDADSVPTRATKVDGEAGTLQHTSQNAVIYGDVDVDDHAETDDATITTITLDGYKVATLGAAQSLDALETLSLANSTENATVTTTSATLTVNLDDVDNNVDLGGAADSVTNLTVNTSDEESDIGSFDGLGEVTDLTVNAAVDLEMATHDLGDTLENVTIAGAGEVDLGDITASVALNSFNASANTGGVTADVEVGSETATGITGDLTEYVFSDGADTVTLVDSDNDGISDIKVSTGAGDDKVILDTGINSAGEMIDGGTGTNTLSMNVDDAVTASAASTFEATFTNFQKLDLNDKADTAVEVDLANMNDIDYVITAGADASAGAASTETAVVTFADITAGQTITIDGVKAIAVADVTAEELEEVFDAPAPTGIPDKIVLDPDNSTDGGAWDGADDGTTTVEFTSGTANTNVTDLDPVEGNAGQGTNATETTGTESNPTDTSDETITWDFTGAQLAVGQQITFNGLTLTAKEAMNADDIAADFADEITTSGNATKSVASGNFAALPDTDTFTNEDWTSSGAELILTDTDGGSDKTYSNTAALAISLEAAASDPAELAVDTTDGVSAEDAATPLLDIINMADNGTVEMNGTDNAGAIVTMTDATGDADTLNVVTANEAGNVGQIAVDDVETVNVTTTDIFTDTNGITDEDGNNFADGVDDTNSTVTLTVNADSAETVNVDGAGDLALTVTNSEVLTTVDATDMTGVLDYDADVANLVVNGGAADDILTADASQVEINGGDGDDTIDVTANAASAIIDGGAGADTFDFTAAFLGDKQYATIKSVEAGDVINMNADSFISDGVVSTDAESVSDWVEAAYSSFAADTANWFQQDGNTYIVDNGAKADEFDATQDVIIKINGLVDLSTASFNDNGTLEIA